MSRKLQIVLPDPVWAQLQDLAAGAGEPPATLARQLVCDGLAVTTKSGTRRTRRQGPTALAATRGRPRWLEPYGGDPHWRRETWGAIVALHARYPRQRKDLKTGWWTFQEHLEILCALAAWRVELDAHADDPREELAFHHQLADYAHTLRQEGGGVAREWKPGPLPEEWITP